MNSLLTPQAPARAQSPRPGARSFEGRWVLGACLLSGVLSGTAHLQPALWPCGWLGVAVLAWALEAPSKTHQAAWGLFGGGSIALWIAHPWQAYSPSAYFPGWAATVGIMIIFTLANVLPQKLPLLLAWRFLGARRMPAVFFLPVAWMLGEHLLGLITQMSYTDWLYSQWGCQPVVNLATHAGGAGSAFICLSVAALAGGALMRRSWVLASLSVIAALALGLVPSRHLPIPTWLSHIGAVHMNSYLHPPRQAPAGISILVWPEQANGETPYLLEGAGNGQQIRPPFVSKGVYHLYGLVTHMGHGRTQNSVLALAPDGRVIQSRAKKWLFPIFERPAFGFGGAGFVPGKAGALLKIDHLQACAVLCCEELDRRLVDDGAKRGADFISVSAIDKVLCHSRVGERQFLGVSVFRAAETGLPLVRSSLYGGASIIGPNGEVLAVASHEKDGILTLH